MATTINGFYKFFLFSRKLVISLDDNCFATTIKRTSKTTVLSFSEISLLQLDEGWMIGFPHKARKRLWCIDKNGKVAFCCSNKQPEFEKFLSQAKKKMSAVEKVRYSRQVRMTILRRLFYINPLYEHSKALKQVWKRAGFHYDAFLFTGICVFFIIGFACFGVFAPREWTDAFDAYIQSFAVKYFSWFIDLMMK